ncbi:MAG: TIGR04255 family protein [Chloroflexi bacterium]|nr:TIGR04255 family protein [Chloroflexota bacterium]
MNDSPLQFHFEEDIHLVKNSLVEAWLEIQWHLEDAPETGLKLDPDFDIAIGLFNQHVKDKFPFRKPLDAARIPSEMLPHVVRYQFRKSDQDWPILQLGPGVATVNSTYDYTWPSFRDQALYLREKITASYEYPLKPKAIILRYRNALSFNYNSGDVLRFLEQSLHISLRYPLSIPGVAAGMDSPSGLNMISSFDLREDIGKGTLQIATGKYKPETEETDAIIFQLEVAANESNVPSLDNESKFAEWLNLAHRVLHDWYFSLIDGTLRTQFEGK